MKLVVDTYPLGDTKTNCYLVRASRGAGEAVVIDPGASPFDLRLELAQMGARCAAILITHCHWDHIGAVAELADGTGAPVYMAEAEAPVLRAPDDFYTALGVSIRAYEPDVLLQGDEAIEVADLELEVLRVPGHSPAHLAYHSHGVLFSGDVLFAGGVGRTDLPGGDWETLVESIRMLVDRFPPETVVYPGHGPATTLGAELQRNPFLAELRA
jgi:glyoxylase-like metal-dependent hydrolase (beta-lactamase superfamily II)